MKKKNRLTKKMTKKQKVRISIIAGVVALVLVVVVFLFSRNSSPEEMENPYSTVTLKKADPLTFNGIVEATTTQDYYLDQTLGKISAINVTDGQTVEANDVLLTYANSEYENQADEQSESLDKYSLAVSAAKENLTTAQNKQASLQQDLNNAKTNYNNTPENSEENIAKREGYDQEITQYEEALDAAKDNVIAARQALDSANLDLSSANQSVSNIREKVTSTVAAASAGRVYINEKGRNDATVPVIQIVSEEVSITGTASEYDYARLQQDQSVTIKPVVNSEEIAGTITHVNQLPNQAAASSEMQSTASTVSNYTFTVQPASGIQYGYNVNISLELDEIRLPNRAVLEEDNQQYVFVYKNGKVQRADIEAKEEDGYLVLQSGLKAKDEIISNPDSSLKDGQELAVN